MWLCAARSEESREEGVSAESGIFDWGGKKNQNLQASASGKCYQTKPRCESGRWSGSPEKLREAEKLRVSGGGKEKAEMGVLWIPRGVHRVGEKNLLLNTRGGTSSFGEVLKNDLHSLSFTGTRLSGHKNRLIASLIKQCAVALVGNTERVRRQVRYLSAVLFHDSRSIDGQQLIRIDGDEDGAYVRVDEVLLGSLLQVHHHGRDVHVFEAYQVVHNVTDAVALEFNELGVRLVDDFVL